MTATLIPVPEAVDGPMPENHGKDWDRGSFRLVLEAWWYVNRFGALPGARTPWVVQLAPILGRTPASIAMIAANAASADYLDPRSGLNHPNAALVLMYNQYLADKA